MSNVQLEMSGDEARLLSSLKRSEAEIERLEAKVKKLNETGEKGSKKTQQELWKEQREVRKLKAAWEETEKAREQAEKPFGDRLIPQLGAFAAGVVSMSTALGLLRAEMEQIARRQKLAADAGVPLNQARQDLIRNMPGATAAEVRSALDSAARVSRETNVEERFVASAMASAMSAASGDVNLAIPAVEMASRFLADRPDAIADYAGSLLDMQKATRVADPRVNMGFLTFIGGLSRVVDPKMQAANIPPAIIGQQPYGGDPRTAAALFAATTTGMADRTGAMSGTAVIRFAEQAQEFFGGDLMPGGKGVVSKRISALVNSAFKAIPAGTEMDRITALQSIPGLAEVFLGRSSFDAKAAGPFRQLLTDPSSGIAMAFRSNLKAMPGNAGMARIADRMIAMRESDPIESNEVLRRVLGSGADELMTRDLVSARGNITEEGLKAILEASGAGWMRTKGLMWGFDAATELGTKEQVKYAASALRQRQRDIIIGGIPEYMTEGFPEGLSTGELRNRASLSSDDERIVNLLGQIADKLDTMNAKANSVPTLAPPNVDK